MKRYDKGYYKAKCKDRYEYLKRVGLCSCGERAEPGKVRCVGCAQKAAAREMLRRQRRDEEREREWLNEQT